METAPASFPQFARLPAELRRKIWRRALPRRAVHLRLKMDMDAWNWATEGDWWAHYLVAADRFPVASPGRALYHGGGTHDDGGDDEDGPALLRVCAEARAEALHAYRRRLALDPATLQRCLETAAGGRDDDDDDGLASAPEKSAPEGLSPRRATQPHLLARMCAPSGAPRFDARRDVVVWAGVRRWCGGGGSSSAGAAATTTTGALFEAACRAARHVVVEYDARLDRPLRALARAVAAAPAPRSLTLQTAAPAAAPAGPYWGGAFRVVAGPGRPVRLPRPDAARGADAGAEAAALLRRHRAVFLPAAPPVPDGGFAVLAVVTPAQLAAIASRGHPATMAVFMDSALARTFAGALTAAQRTDGRAGGPEAAAPFGPKTAQSFHGFCDPDYGLP